MEVLIEVIITKDYVKDLDSILIVKIQAYQKEYGKKEY